MTVLVAAGTGRAWRPGVGTTLRAIFGRDAVADEGTSPDEVRDRSTFVQDMLARNSDAFVSEQDVQSMMQLYPGRF